MSAKSRRRQSASNSEGRPPILTQFLANPSLVFANSVRFHLYAYILATELRKNLFQTLEKASKGEPVLIEYKGVSLRLEAVTGKRKLSNAVRRNSIVGDPELLVGSDVELMDQLEKKWAAEDAEL